MAYQGPAMHPWAESCIIFAAICVISVIGLYLRASWMWYVGRLILQLFAACMGHILFKALSSGYNTVQIVFACMFVGGCLVLWLPCARWWFAHPHWFGLFPRIQCPNETETPAGDDPS
eukprot:gene7932-9803_t